jgi:CRP-like cAMP-binding protein
MDRTNNQTNLLLSSLEPELLALIEPDLEDLELPVRTSLERRGLPIEHVYFFVSGLASVVSNGDKPVEVGLIGREGMTGVPLLLGDPKAPYETYVQVAGRARRLPTAALQQAIKDSPVLFSALLGDARTFLAQVTETARANAIGKLDQRLARWLLLVNEFLGLMLAVRRPGVSVAIEELGRSGVIAHERSAITILDRQALETLAGSIYTRPDWAIDPVAVACD